MEKASKSGYSLVELLVVLGLMGILAAIAWPGYTAWRERQWRLQAIEALLEVRLRQARAYLESGRYLAREELVLPSLPPRARYTLSSRGRSGYRAVIELDLPAGRACRRYAISEQGPVQARGFAGPECWVHP